MQLVHDLATGMLEQEGKYGMDEAADGPHEHLGSKAERMAHMLEIALVYIVQMRIPIHCFRFLSEFHLTQRRIAEDAEKMFAYLLLIPKIIEYIFYKLRLNRIFYYG